LRRILGASASHHGEGDKRNCEVRLARRSETGGHLFFSQLPANPPGTAAFTIPAAISRIEAGLWFKTATG
jgi:hypothetical protein